MKYYCEDCHELACPVCVLHGSHSTHNTVEIRDFITKVKEDLPQFQQTIKDKVHQLTTLDDDIKGNLQRTMDVKEEIKTAAKLLREKIDEQELFFLQNCTEQCEKPLMEASTITNELMMILMLDTLDTVSVMSKIAKWNKLAARNKVFSLKTPSFFGNPKVDLGDCKILNFLHSLSVLNIGMEPRFHKDVEITIKDDVPLHISALEDGGVIYAGNKSCRQIDRFGKKIMSYELTHKNVFCLSTKNDELFVFTNTRMINKWNVCSGAVLKNLRSVNWYSNDVVILSSDEYLNIREGQKAVLKNGNPDLQIVTGLVNPTCMSSYQEITGDLIILVADRGGKKVFLTLMEKTFTTLITAMEEFSVCVVKMLSVCIK